MNSTFFLQSKRFWGIFITAAATIAPVVGPFFGFNVNAGDIVEVGGAGTDLITSAGQFLGLVLAFWGSMKAEGPMVLTPGD